MNKEKTYCEKEYYQVYYLHLINGDIIEAMEKEDEPATLINLFCVKNDDYVFTIGDAFTGYSYIPRRSILYITENGVKSVDLGTVNALNVMG